MSLHMTHLARRQDIFGLLATVHLVQGGGPGQRGRSRLQRDACIQGEDGLGKGRGGPSAGTPNTIGMAADPYEVFTGPDRERAFGLKQMRPKRVSQEIGAALSENPI